jgi:hypothetical protein
MWVYFAIAIPLSCLSFIVVGKWSDVLKGWEYLFRTAPYRYSSSRRERWQKLPIKGWNHFVRPLLRKLR